MNRKLVIYFTMSFMFVIAVFVILGNRATDDNRVETVAQEIADFELPPTYASDYVIDAGPYTIAAYKSDDGQSHLAFVRIPENLIPDNEVIAGHVFGGTSRQSQREATVLSTETRIVRGQPATLTISERINGDGVLYQSAYLVFTGKEGTAVLTINQPAAEWDAADVEAFIASIR
jgi:hypothetical protein